MLDLLLAQVEVPSPLVQNLIWSAIFIIGGVVAFSINIMAHNNAGVERGIKKKALRTDRFAVQANVDAVRNSLRKNRALKGFECYGIDTKTKTWVFGTKFSIWTPGYYHRITVKKNPKGGSNVTIETSAKWMTRIGPPVTKAQKIFVKSARAALGIYKEDGKKRGQSTAKKRNQNPERQRARPQQ